MTRINAGIPVELLTDQHLVAEYREILRVGPLFKKRLNSSKGFDDIPIEFKFATGHVKFFYNKGLYINKRWHQLYQELIRRKFNPKLQFYDHWESAIEYKLDYNPPSNVTEIVKERIKSNILNQKEPIRYFGQIITNDHYFENVLK